MKDLKHYFTDTVKVCDTSNDDKEVREPAAVATASNVEATSNSPTMTNTSKKRGRVKIKISQNNTKGKVCNIIDSNNDLVDKTPSPFAQRSGKKEDQDDTPKRSTSRRRNDDKDNSVKVVEEKKASKKCSVDKKLSKKNDESDVELIEISESDTIDNSLIFEASPASKETENGEREESNAFRVLMTRKKSVQYKEAAATDAAEEEAAALAAEELRAKQKRNKEKLITMADKKGYSKRKVEELEEAEKIERRLEKRAKVFKQMGKKDGGEKNPGRRVSPGSLHDYFSKPNPEQKQGELMAVCTLTKQTEVISDLPSLCEVEELQKTEIVMKKGDRKVLEKNVDDKQVPGNPRSPKKPLSEQLASNQQRSKKPKWSLRINLTCNGNEVATDRAIVLDDESPTDGKRSSRHRKSKAKPPNYEENENSDNDVTNVKTSKKKKMSSNVQKNKTPPKPQTNVSNEALVIDLISSPDKKTAVMSSDLEIIETKVVKPSTTEKLAPLFVKRPKTDPAILEARRLFLHSIPTESDPSKPEKRSTPIVGTPLLPFPTISHVTQLNVELTNVIQNDNAKIKFPPRENRPFTPSFDPNDFESITRSKNNSSKNSEDSVDKENAKENSEEILSDIESRCKDAREIWKRISSTANCDENLASSPKKKAKKRKSNEKKAEIAKEKIVEGRIWTSKYRPLSSRDIVGNEEAAEKLRKWLEGWKAPVRRDDDESGSSGDEFYSSDCSYASNFDNNQVAVLLGPHGSGKTASVYAVAEELGYSILEINASSKRTGKKILKDLEEATKSHRIKKPGALSLAPSLDKKKPSTKNSLILVEDVDLIFEEDEGFISATCQLASNTKRPMVMTVRDTCLHLNRMAPQQHRIYYQATVGSRTSALLELITLAESGYRLPGPCLDRLLLGGDLRKALLQLQYLLLSGKPKASEVPKNFHQSLWQDIRNSVYKPAIKATKKSSKKKPTDNETPNSPKERAIVAQLAKNLERLSFVSTLIEIEDPALEVSALKTEPSLSLDENERPYSSANNTSEEIAKWLRDRSMNDREIVDSTTKNSQQLSIKKSFNSGINFALSQVSPMNNDGRVMAVDYLPFVREICRSEDKRITTNNKRGNRFFHYLQSLKLPTTSTRSNILSAACKIMRERSNSES